MSMPDSSSREEKSKEDQLEGDYKDINSLHYEEDIPSKQSQFLPKARNLLMVS
jgi:hypothetical protein